MKGPELLAAGPKNQTNFNANIFLVKRNSSEGQYFFFFYSTFLLLDQRPPLECRVCSSVLPSIPCSILLVVTFEVLGLILSTLSGQK